MGAGSPVRPSSPPLDASLAEGNTLTFLLADADDWPYRLYERLGFETAGRRWRFQRLPAPRL